MLSSTLPREISHADSLASDRILTLFSSRYICISYYYRYLDLENPDNKDTPTVSLRVFLCLCINTCASNLKKSVIDETHRVKGLY